MKSSTKSALAVTVVLVLAAAALTGCHKSDPKSDQQSAAAALCASQTQQYQASLAAFQQSEQARIGRCDALDREQADINGAFSELGHDYPFTVDAVEHCAKEPTDEQKRNCLLGACVVALVGNVNCDDAIAKLKHVGQRQDIVNSSLKRDCCKLVTKGEMNEAMSYAPDLSCTAPVAPTAPVCAAPTTP
jgi:hypothetical protein